MTSSLPSYILSCATAQRFETVCKITRSSADDFENELWPRLARAVDGEHGMFELYLDNERIWDLVALDNGEELLKRCGLLPIDLLYGYPEIGHLPYPKILHDKIVQLLLRREDRTIQALMKFRSEPLFHKLIAREMSSKHFQQP